MRSKKKLLTSAVALGTAAVLALGGTFAWQSINQTALNEASDIVNPGGRLHNDLYYVDAKTTDSNVYVENFADDEIFARVRLEEYMEVVMNYGTAAERVEIVTGEKALKDGVTDVSADGATQKDQFDYTYTVHKFGEDAENAAAAYFQWAVGTADSAAVYMPTFNVNKDSLAADIHGLYADRVGGISSRSEDQYTESPWAVDDEKTGNEIYDADYNSVDELNALTVEDLNALIDNGTGAEAFADNINLKDATHTAAAVGSTRGLISMDEWLTRSENDEETDRYWVYDEDGWVYWSSPIAAHSTTGLLLDSFTLDHVMDDTWYYAVNVVGQFVTANDVGKRDGTGFYAVESEKPTAAAETLLDIIGVDMSGEGEGPAAPDEPADPAEEATISLALYDADGAAVTGSTLKANSTYDIVGTLNTQSGDFVIYDSRDGQTSDEKVSAASCTPYTVAYDTGENSYNTVNEQGQLVTGDNDTFNYAKVSEDQYKDLTLYISASDVKVYETAADEGDPVETYDSLSASWNYYPEGGEVYQWKGGQDVMYVSPNADNTVDTWSVVDGNEQPISADRLTYKLTGNTDENTTLAYQGGKIVLAIGDDETASSMYITAKDGNGKAERVVHVKYHGTLLVDDTVLNVGYNNSVTSILSSPDATKSYTLTYKDFWGNEVSDATFYIAYRGLIDYGSSIVGNMLMLGVNEQGFLGIAVCGGMPDYPSEEILYYCTPVVEQPEATTMTITINGGTSYTFNDWDGRWNSEELFHEGDTITLSSNKEVHHWTVDSNTLEGNTYTFDEIVIGKTIGIMGCDADGESVCYAWFAFGSDPSAAT